MIRLILLIFTLFFLTNCSIRDTVSIWTDKENVENQKNIKKLFSKEKKIISELNPDLKLDLSKLKIKKNIIDNKNNFGAQNYSSLKKKAGSFKFSKIEDPSNLNYKPLFLNDGLIFFDKKGTIIRYDSNNKVVWKKNYYSKSEKRLSPKLYFALADQNLLIADSIAKYYSINLKSGELNWSKNGSYSFNSEIKKENNKFFIVDYKNTLRSFSVDDGTELWNFKTEDSFAISDTKNSLIIVEDLLIFSNSIGDITSINIETGLITWQLPTQSSDIINESYNFKTSRLVSDGKSIYFSNNKGEFYSIDVKTGVANWINEINSNIMPSVTGNLIFTISNEGYLYVLEKNNGNILRITNLYENYKENKRPKIKPIGFIIGNTNLYLTNSDGKLIVAELATGNVNNIIKVSNSLTSEPFIFNKNLFVIKNGSIVQYN